MRDVDLFSGVILDKELYARRLSSNKHATQDLPLHQDLPILPDMDSLWLGSRWIIPVHLHDVYDLLVGHKSSLPLVYHSDRGPDLIPQLCDARAEVD